MVSPTPEILRRQLADACLSLVQVPSQTGQEKRLADRIEKWARGVVDRHAIRRVGNSVVLGGPDGVRPCVALVGHLDTVPASEHAPPQGCHGDRVVGLGASDMKGSIAVMQALAENHNLDALPLCLTLILYDKEEGPYAENGLQPVLDGCDDLSEIDLAIAMEPTDNTLQLGCLGAMHARVTYTGRAAHSARPWQGENAIHKAGPFLSRVAEQPSTDVDVEGLVFRNSMSVTLAHGGGARNVVPDRFDLNLNVRFAPVEDAVDKAREAVAAITQDADEVAVVDVAVPGPVPTHSPLLAHLQAVADLPIEPKLAWTDVARLAAHGIDAVNFGPGFSAEAHQPTEWISVEAMAYAYEVVSKMLKAPLAVAF